MLSENFICVLHIHTLFPPRSTLFSHPLNLCLHLSFLTDLSPIRAAHKLLDVCLPLEHGVDIPEAAILEKIESSSPLMLTTPFHAGKVIFLILVILVILF